jgi:phage tail protein X
LSQGPTIEYQVQEGEALVAIAETFGVSRRAILLANVGMADQKPYTQPGDIIIVPVAAALAPEVIEAVPGFIRYLE